MLKQLSSRKIESLRNRICIADDIIRELVGAMNIPSEEIRALCIDKALDYLATNALATKQAANFDIELI